MRVRATSRLSAMLALLGAAGLAVASSAPTASPARAQPLVADLSEHRVAITTGFVGTKVVLFGATDGEGDVVVVVRGPFRRELVRRKSRVAGIWINDAEMAFSRVPAYYALASSRELAELVPLSVMKRHEIGADHLRLEPEASMDAAAVAAFRAALLRNKRRQGLYPAEVGKVTFLGPRLFRTVIEFPANVPTGEYQVLVHLLRDGQEVAGGSQGTPLEVSKGGIEGDVFDFAHRKSALYGIIAIVVALAAGWLAGVVFRKA